ncbi:MAG TPA: hypothetical protein VFV86_11185 [Nitrososphaeraceae archaeon]|nr:hypothetical protein [Nitrososphaeraceae archaeon]
MYEDSNLPLIEKRGRDDLEYMIDCLSRVPQFYNWEMYSNVEDLRRSRSSSLKEFVSDYKAKEQLINHFERNKRYVKAVLPKLPFGYKSFDLVLSSNFLFYYHNMFDYDFHHDSILEMLRVASKEVRIFPVQKPDAKIPEYFDTLMESINKHMKKKFHSELRK